MKIKFDQYLQILIKDTIQENENLIEYYFPFLAISIFSENLYYSLYESKITQDKKYFEKYGLDLFEISIVKILNVERLNIRETGKINQIKKIYDLKLNPYKYNLGIIEYMKA